MGLTSVGNEDLGVFYPLGAVGSNLLVQDEACMFSASPSIQPRYNCPDSAPGVIVKGALTLIQIRVRQLAANLFDNLDMLQIRAPLQPQYRVHCQIRKIVLVMAQHLAAQRRPRNIKQILPERFLVFAIVHRRAFQRSKSGARGNSVALHSGLRVQVVRRDQLFGLAQEFRSEHADGCGAVSDLVVLHFGNVDEDLGGGIVERDGF